MRVSDYVVSLTRLKQHLDRQVRDDRDTVASDYFLRNYYQQGGRLLWVDRQGVDRRADTLLAYLRHVDKIGFSPNRFRVPQIEADLHRMRIKNSFRRLDTDYLTEILRTHLPTFTI